MDITHYRNDIEKLAKKHGIANLRLFGSFARGEEREDSDVDFLGSIKNKTLSRIHKFIDDAQELLGRKVQLVDDTRVYPLMQKNIFGEATPLSKLDKKKKLENRQKFPGKDIRVYLLDIYKSAQLIEQYMKPGKRKYLKDSNMQDAISHRLCIIGEAVNKIPRDWQAGHKNIPWKQLVDTRNKVIHEYDGTNYGKLWDETKKIIPGLDKKIDKLIAALSK